jgi:hypothetical protein
LLALAGGSDAEAEETCVVSQQLILNGRVVHEVTENQLAELVVPNPAAAPSHREYPFNVSIEQALSQHTLPDHSCCTEENYLQFVTSIESMHY